MPTELFMPQLGLTMLEGKVIEWLIAEGDSIKKGEPIIVIETDKVTVEIEAPSDGILGRIIAKEGDILPIGKLLGYIAKPGESIPIEEVGMEAIGAQTPTNMRGATDQSAEIKGKEKIIASPRAKRLAENEGVIISDIKGTGPGGRIIEDDIRSYLDKTKETELLNATPIARRLAADLKIDLSKITGSGRNGQITKHDVLLAASSFSAHDSEMQPEVGHGPIEQLKGIRRLVAERTTHSFTSTPHFYLSIEVEATNLVRIREEKPYADEIAPGISVTVTDFIVKACSQALSEAPNVNVTWAEDFNGWSFVHQPDINIGIAIALENGLIVPVIHNVDQLILAEIARKRVDLINRALSGKLTLSDLEGGTFTVSNLGMYGVDSFQAIINPPQSAILAVGRIRERPFACNGELLVRPTMFITLSIDHRLLDGSQGADFLQHIAQLIENPKKMIS